MIQTAVDDTLMIERVVKGMKHRIAVPRRRRLLKRDLHGRLWVRIRHVKETHTNRMETTPTTALSKALIMMQLG